jgi:hypothetical protein
MAWFAVKIDHQLIKYCLVCLHVPTEFVSPSSVISLLPYQMDTVTDL